MKVTVSAAMRARDVSRPREEQLAEAEAAEASIPSGPGANVTAEGGARGDEARDAAYGIAGRRKAAPDERGGELAGDGARAEVRDGEERDGTRADRKGRLD